VSKDATWGRGEETKKGQKLSCVKLAISHIDIASWKFACGVLSGSSYIFQVSWKSVEGSPSCGGSLPLTRPMAYTTACTAVQAVICVGIPEFLVTPLLIRPVYVLSEGRFEEPVRLSRHLFSILRAFSAGARSSTRKCRDGAGCMNVSVFFRVFNLTSSTQCLGVNIYSLFMWRLPNSASG